MLDALCPDEYLNNPRTCCSVVLYWYSVVLHKDKSCDVHMAYDLLMINIRYSFIFFCKQSPSSQSEHSSQHRQCNCTWGNASILWILFSGQIIQTGPKFLMRHNQHLVKHRIGEILTEYISFFLNHILILWTTQIKSYTHIKTKISLGKWKLIHFLYVC